MDTAKLKRFAQYARRALIELVAGKLNLVLAETSLARRENPEAVRKLEEEIKEHGREQVVERVSYLWFNRFCALRFMDMNRYTRIGVVSPLPGQFQPEILAEAKMGHIDEEMIPEKTRKYVFSLLNGSAPSPDPQTEAFRMLIVAVCNDLHKLMPFLFQRIADYSELLMPDDLLSGTSILAYTREALTPDACKDVESIGWLYQFYISEKKDQVFEGLKKNKKITPENIPAATQLFTPHWIVRYLVENSLGRLWLLNRPKSRLIEKMEYFIKPEQPETDFLRILKPEDIKICDPACGSGHMLVYAFDLLYAIYEEEGYEPSEIPEKILTHNLYGIEIDERAGELASFALMMKALQYDKRFLRRKVHGKPIEPNICVLENIHFEADELKPYMDFVGRNLFTVSLEVTLRQFEEADNFGSLIRPEVTNVTEMLEILNSKNVSGQLLLSLTHQRVLKALRQADYLNPKYHVVIANPPYMGSKGMNDELKTFAQKNYPDSKSDLFSMFIERNLDLAQKQGEVAMITMQSWMFLASFEKLRSKILENDTILSMAHLGPRAFDTIGGEVVSTTAFVLKKAHYPDYFGSYIRLVDGKSETEKKEMLKSPLSSNLKGPQSLFFRASSFDFKKIPGNPYAYWAPKRLINIFEEKSNIGNFVDTAQGMKTLANERFIREWTEVSFKNSSISFEKMGKKWFPINHGGEYRKWYGNNESFLNWENDGMEIKILAQEKYNSVTRTVTGMGHYFKEGITWSAIAINRFGVRRFPEGYLFTNAGMCAFGKKVHLDSICCFLNSKVAHAILEFLSPTINFGPNQIQLIPFDDFEKLNECLQQYFPKLLNFSKVDWNSFEISWEFLALPLLEKSMENFNSTNEVFFDNVTDQSSKFKNQKLNEAYSHLRAHWQTMTREMQRLEEENNRIFIEAYGLQDELAPDVPLHEITLTCNPHYRYGGDNTEEELETLLLADTMKEFISYAVGCMCGRYSLDKPGLILANQGEGIADYFGKIFDLDPNDAVLQDQSKIKNLQSKISFLPDDDNVIPILDEGWFSDDITQRFQEFLKVTFGREHFDENLKFIEKAIGKDIRKYFLKDFYNDHVKRYKKRPIYWLFSSSKGSFNVLIYMHRYRPDTLSVILNDYLREFRTKLTARKTHLEAVSISGNASQTEKTKALKEIETLKKMIDELDNYERDTLYPLATKKIEIDLDDGVKVNYQKFGSALKKIPGLDAKEDD